MVAVVLAVAIGQWACDTSTQLGGIDARIKAIENGLSAGGDLDDIRRCAIDVYDADLLVEDGRTVTRSALNSCEELRRR